MTEICDAEDLDAEPAALTRLGRAAAGSMRDGLSLLDQALAYGADTLVDGDVAAMLGSMDRHRIVESAQGLARATAPSCWRDRRARRTRAGLRDRARRTGDRVAAHRRDPGRRPGRARGRRRARVPAGDSPSRIDAERLQLYYQIAVTSRRDIGLAPEPRLGFEMAMLRMLAFRPAAANHERGAARHCGRPAAAPAARRKSRKPKRACGAGRRRGRPCRPRRTAGLAGIRVGLGLEGAARQLAENSALQSSSPFELRLGVERRNEHLLTDKLKARLARRCRDAWAAASTCISRDRCDARHDGGQAAEAAEEDMRQARDTIQNDPDVQEIVDSFGGEVVPDSIRPVQPEDNADTA